MCGILGIISASTTGDDELNLRKATSLLRHRGPDSSGFGSKNEGFIKLGHTRLCIIDPTSGGSQPFFYQDRFTLVYNGEIYNYKELREELQKAGVSFKTNSDTEVLIASYARWGEACLQKFDGAFAFAIWDEVEQHLFAARDPFGEKPLYFHYDGERLLLASEIKSFPALGVALEVNPSMVYNFLTIDYTSNPLNRKETFFNNIQKLPSSSSLSFKRGGEPQVQIYWQLFHEERAWKEEEAVQRFNELFNESILRRLRSDVPIATSLSGGLDSSAIVARCAGLKSGSYTHKCFTASFEGFERDETRYAKEVASKFNLEHHPVTISEEGLPELMDEVMKFQDEPILSSSALAQFAVFKEASRQGIKVMLDGQGADEVFAGYEKYFPVYWRELYKNRKLRKSMEREASRELGLASVFGFPHKLLALFPDFGGSMLENIKERKAKNHSYLSRDFRQEQKRQLYYTRPLGSTLKHALHFDTAIYGLEELLRMADRNSMASSVEVRLPFLNRELVQAAFSLPSNFLIRGGRTKWIIRKALEKELPESVINRTDKTGFEPPQQKWMQNSRVQQRIEEGRRLLVSKGILDPGVLKKKVQPHGAHAAEKMDWKIWSLSYLYSS